MPTARHSTSVLSLQSKLIVVGGDAGYYLDAVEIFRADTSQWYKTDPLPTACCGISPVVIGKTCYILGGFKYPSHLNQTLHASVDDLLRNAVPANQTNHIVTQSSWKVLAKTPTSGPAAAVIGGNLLAISGKGKEGTVVYMYSPSTNSWICFGDLPEPQSYTSVAILSSTEILVAGGSCGDKKNIVYKGTLTLNV